jgi:hypothetical protein
LKKDGDSDRYKTILEFIKMGLNSWTQRCLENVYFSCVHGAVFNVTRIVIQGRIDDRDGGGGDDEFCLNCLLQCKCIIYEGYAWTLSCKATSYHPLCGL